jgi:predicted metal-dependent HD superfamily phosphohydrolase
MTVHFCDKREAESNHVRRWVSLFGNSLTDQQLYPTLSDMAAYYTSCMRHHHTFHRHLEEIHADLQPITDLLQDPDGVTIAVDAHDVIQDFRVGNDEENSLAWINMSLQLWGFDQAKDFPSMEPCILATKHLHDAPPNPDAQYFADADIAVLGKSSERYNIYVSDIRKEYAYVGDTLYRPKRAAVMQGFLDRPRIYWTDHFADLYEVQARANLKQEIALLTKGL